MGISRPPGCASHSAQSRTPSMARSASTSESTSGLPPSRAASRANCSRRSCMRAAARRRMSIRRAGLSQRSRSPEERVGRLQRPLDALRSAQATVAIGDRSNGAKTSTVPPFGLSPGNQQRKMLCHDSRFGGLNFNGRLWRVPLALPVLSPPDVGQARACLTRFRPGAVRHGADLPGPPLPDRLTPGKPSC